jgi:hypothetical protein
VCAPCAGSAADITPREGEESPRLLRRFELPAPALFVGTASKADQETPLMTSPYLDRPLLPLTVALPRLLEQNRSRTRHSETGWEVAPPPTRHAGARAAAHPETDKSPLDLAAYRAGLSDPSGPRANLSLRPVCEVGSCFLPRLVGFWWRSMPRGPARNDRKVVNFPRQVSAPSGHFTWS